MLRLIKRSEEVGANPLEGCGLSPYLCRLLCMRGVRTPQEAALFSLRRFRIWEIRLRFAAWNRRYR